MLAGEKDNLIIKEIQPKYGINNRQANAIRCEAKAAIASAKELAREHLKKIKAQIKSTKSWVKKQQKKLKTLPIASDLKTMGKHVWSAWYALNRKLNKQLMFKRHSYFSLSNRELEVMLQNDFLALQRKVKKGFCGKRQRTSRIRCKSEG